MAIPFSFTQTVTLAPLAHSGGPYKSSASNIYTILLDSTNRNQIEAWHAANPESDFSAVGTNPDVTTSVDELQSHHSGGDTVHVATVNDNSGGLSLALRYHQFDMDSNSWAVSNETVVTTFSTASIGIHSRTDGDVIVCYLGAQESVMGMSYNRIYYARREGGVWTIDQRPDNLGKVEFAIQGPFLVGAGDRTHIFYKKAANNDIMIATLAGDNTFSQQDKSVIGTSSLNLDQGKGISYTDGSETKIRLPVGLGSTAALVAFNDSSAPSASVVSVSDTASGFTDMVIAANGTDQHAMWTRSMFSARGIARDVNTGAGWGTDITASVTINASPARVFANIYSRNSAKLAFVHNDAGSNNIVYNEIDLGGGGATTVITNISLDSIIKKQGAIRQAFLDGILQKQGNTTSVGLDAMLTRVMQTAISLDGLLKKVGTSAVSLDGVLKKLGITSSVGLDAILTNVETSSISLDAVLRKAITSALALDAILKREGATTSVGLDAAIRDTFTTAIALDGILQQMKTTAVSLGGLLQAVNTTSIGLDGFLASAGGAASTTDISLDAVLQAVHQTNITLDGILQAQKTSGVSLDAAIQQVGITTGVSLDAAIQEIFTSAISLDAALQSVNTSTLSLDAALQEVQSTVITLSGTLLKSSTTRITLDAFLRELWADRNEPSDGWVDRAIQSSLWTDKTDTNTTWN